MRVVELKDLRKKDTPLHYIREWNGVAVLERGGRTVEKPFVCSIERRPVGAPDITARFLEDPEWPLLPLLRSLKELLAELDKNGSLP
jgi:hypothetical protein